MRPRGPGRRRASPPKSVDPNQLLFEVGAKDIWQAELLSAEGIPAGRVIRQIIEPGMYTVRYVVVYDPRADRHFLIPTTSVVDISEAGVQCNLSLERIARLPAFNRESVTRGYEESLFRALGSTPYWEEENALLRRPPGPEEK